VIEMKNDNYEFTNYTSHGYDENNQVHKIKYFDVQKCRRSRD
jgi:hypothetical protein